MMADLVPDHRADAAIVDRRIGLRIEERRLQDRGGEGDRDQRRVGLRVDRHRGHAPFPAIDRLAELADVVVVRATARRAASLPNASPARIVERRIIAPLVGIADPRHERGELGDAPSPWSRAPSSRACRSRAFIAAMTFLTSASAAALVSGGKYLRDVELARRRRSARPAVKPTARFQRSSCCGRARQRRAEERELLLVERGRQHVGIAVERADQQLVAAARRSAPRRSAARCRRPRSGWPTMTRVDRHASPPFR